MKYWIGKIFPASVIALGLVFLPGCGTTTPPTRPSPGLDTRIDLSEVGKDLQQVGQDLGPPETTNTAQMAGHIQELGRALPSLGANLQTLGRDYPGKAATPLEKHLANLGGGLQTMGADLKNVGVDIQSGNKSQLVLDQAQLAAHSGAANGLGLDLMQLSLDLTDATTDTNVLTQDFKSMTGDTKTFAAHMKALAGHMATGQDPLALGPDLTTVGKDFASAVNSGRTHSTNQFGDFQIMAGYITLNPYTVTNGPSGSRLTPASSAGSPTIQMEYARRWAWDNRGTTNRPSESIFVQNDEGSKISPLDWNAWDIQMRGGYTFNSFTNSAATIIGSGDVDLELNAGLQLMRWSHKRSAGSIDFDLGVETASEREFDSAHSTLFAGPAFITSFNALSDSNRAFVLARIGGAMYDVPSFTTGGYISTNGIGMPNFSHVGGFAFEFESAYPISAGTYVIADARIYPTHTIAPWTIWVGVSLSASQLANAFKSFAGL